MSNLPQIAQLDFPETDISTTSTSTTVHTTYDWDFDKGDFNLKDGKLIELSGIDYVKVWVQKALLTVKNSLIYAGTDYGNESYSLIGQNFHPDYEKAEMIRMIQDCMLQNDAITGVDSFSFSQSGSNLNINFNLLTIYGPSNQQVVI